MDRDDYERAVRQAAERIAVAADGHLDVTVPSCPGWTEADLLEHVVVVVSFWGAIAAAGEDPPTDWQPPQRPADPAVLVAWYRDEVATATDAWAGLDPATPRWSWSRQHDAGFIQRRMANELTVHAHDAERAIGIVDPIDTAMAVDGIDELLDLFLPAKEACLAGPPLTAHLHATDADGEWMVTIGDGQHHLERAHGKGDVAVRAPASDLLLWLWGRGEADGDGFTVFGDEATLADFVRRVRQW